MNERIEKILKARHIHIFGKVEKLIVKNEIPQNAYIIDLNPSMFVQFGKNGFIITDGSVWLDEDMEDGGVKEKNTWWKYLGKGKWKVHNESTWWLPKDFIINTATGTIVEELPPDQMPQDYDGLVYWTEDMEIFIDGDKVVKKIYDEDKNVNTFERHLWDFTTWTKIDEGDTKYFLPLSSVNEWFANAIHYLLMKDTKFLEDFGIVYASDKENIGLVNLPKPPENAWLISVDPPLWLQLGKGKYIITRGVFWLNEDIEETHEKDFEWYYDDENERWVIRLKEPNFISGEYVGEKDRIIPAHLADDPDYKRYRMFNWWIKIYNDPEDRDIIVQEGCIICDEEDDDDYYQMLFPAETLKFVKISVYDENSMRGITMWAPKYYTFY